VGDVLSNARHGGELVQHAFDPDAGHGRTGDRGEQGTPDRVSDRVPESRLQRLDHEPRPELVDLLFSKSWTLSDEHYYPFFPPRPAFCRPDPVTATRRPPPRAARSAAAPAGSYLEYSSTMSCSWTCVS